MADRIVEAVARSVRKTVNPRCCEWHAMAPPYRKDWLRGAKKIIAALAEEGLVVVPRHEAGAIYRAMLAASSTDPKAE